MNRARSLTKTILESRSDEILYHFTSFGNLINILRTDKLGFRKTVSFTTNPELHKDVGSVAAGGWYMSDELGLGSGGVPDAVIVVDKSKLKRDYTIIPYDDEYKGKDEAEERVTDGPIKNASSYIIGIATFDHGNISMQQVNQYVRLMKKRGIRVPTKALMPFHRFTGLRSLK